MATRRRDPALTKRLTIMLLLIGIAGTLVMMRGPAGRLPEGDWYEVSRQRILQADLTYRMAMYLDLVLPDAELPGLGGARRLKEQALAAYEREALSGSPGSAALHRLGIIYGHRGYDQQAREVLNRAARMDEERAGLFFSLAAIYSPPESPRRLRPDELQRLRRQEQWLAGIALGDYYHRIGQTLAASQAEAAARRQTSRFGLRVLLLLGVYGMLGLIGLMIIVLAIVRWGFYVHRQRPLRPSVVVPWEPLDSLEVVALLYFAIVATGVLAGLLVLRVLPGIPDYLRVVVMAVQYLLATLGALYVIWRRVAGLNHRKLSILGMRLRQPLRQVAEGIGGYAVLVVVLVLLTAIVPGGPALGWIAQAGERALSVAHSVPARVGLFILICVLAPILEEAVFRGFVYPGLRRRLNVPGAVIMSAALFALMHNNPAALVPIGVIGIVLAILYERNLSLIPCIICHALNNTLVFFLMLLTM